MQSGMKGFGIFYLIMHTAGSLSSYAPESETKTQAKYLQNTKQRFKTKSRVHTFKEYVQFDIGFARRFGGL